MDYWAANESAQVYGRLQLLHFRVGKYNFSKPMAGTDKVVVTTRVNYSQRAKETPLKTWLLAKKDGNVCMVHCNCMAGLCEACLHVGALLCATEAGIRMREVVTCTQGKSR